MSVHHTRHAAPDPRQGGSLEFRSWCDGVLSRHDELLPTTRSVVGQTFYRTFELDAERVKKGESQRTVEAILSAGTEVQRRGYSERLDMSPEAINLQRAKELDGLPLLWSHDPSRHLGFAENVRIVNGALQARLRFTDSPEALEKWRSIVDRTLRSISIGYSIEEDEWSDSNSGTPRMLAKRWTPVEASVVTIPADTAARIGRSLDLGLLTETPDDLRKLRQQRAALKEYDLLTWATESDENVEERVSQTMEAIRAHLIEAETPADFSALNVALRAAQAEVDSALNDTEINTVRPPEPEVLGYTRANHFAKRQPIMKQEFSLCRALASQFDPQAAANAGFERELTQDLQRRAGRSAEGIMIPETAVFTRALDKATEGGDLINVDHMSNLFVERLRPRLVVGQLGATMLEGLQGDVQIPRKTADSSAGWIAGDGADSVAQSVPTFDKILMKPTTVGVQCTISRKMLLQGDPASEQLVRETLANAVAQAIDVAALVGTGSSNQPRGIVNITGIGSLEYTNGATPDFGKIVDMEGELVTENADMGRLGYVAHSGVAMGLKKTQVVTGQDRMVWTSTGNGQGLLNGYRALVSNNLSAGHALFGNWADLLIGFWSGLDVTVDPYTRAAYGDVVITIMQDCDIQVRHAESFCELKEAA